MSDTINLILQPPTAIDVTLAIGPPGPVGPQGPAGSAGLYEVVTTSSTIPIGQLFTLVNASGITTQTLPLLSSVITNNVTTVYVIYNINNFRVNIVGSGSDQVQFSSSLTVLFPKESVSLLATSEYGWVII